MILRKLRIHPLTPVPHCGQGTPVLDFQQTYLPTLHLTPPTQRIHSPTSLPPIHITSPAHVTYLIPAGLLTTACTSTQPPHPIHPPHFTHIPHSATHYAR